MVARFGDSRKCTDIDSISPIVDLTAAFRSSRCQLLYPGAILALLDRNDHSHGSATEIHRQRIKPLVDISLLVEALVHELQDSSDAAQQGRAETED